MAEKFVTFNLEDVEEFIEQEENVNTERKTKNDLSLIQLFLTAEKETRTIEEIPPRELDLFLSRFLLSVRKKNGEEYEPTTLRGFIASVERHLKKCRYTESVITGQSFSKTRETEVKTKTTKTVWERKQTSGSIQPHSRRARHSV